MKLIGSTVRSNNMDKLWSAVRKTVMPKTREKVGIMFWDTEIGTIPDVVRNHIECKLGR